MAAKWYPTFLGGVTPEGPAESYKPRARATIPKTALWLDVFVDSQLAATRRNKGKLIDTPRLAHGTWPQGDDRFPGGPQTTRKTDFHKDFASKTHPLIFFGLRIRDATRRVMRSTAHPYYYYHYYYHCYRSYRIPGELLYTYSCTVTRE